MDFYRQTFFEHEPRPLAEFSTVKVGDMLEGFSLTGGHMNSKTVVALFFVHGLVACATPEERADRAIARYAPYCERFGFERGTESWRSCILEQENIRSMRRG